MRYLIHTPSKQIVPRFYQCSGRFVPSPVLWSLLGTSLSLWVVHSMLWPLRILISTTVSMSDICSHNHPAGHPLVITWSPPPWRPELWLFSDHLAIFLLLSQGSSLSTLRFLSPFSFHPLFNLFLSNLPLNLGFLTTICLVPTISLPLPNVPLVGLPRWSVWPPTSTPLLGCQGPLEWEPALSSPPFYSGSRLALPQISTKCVVETLATEEKLNFLDCCQYWSLNKSRGWSQRGLSFDFHPVNFSWRLVFMEVVLCKPITKII